VIFKDGDAPDKMYVVISGVVEIHLRDAVIETVPQGGTFGESHSSIARRGARQLLLKPTLRQKARSSS
jgi:CRP-like cAMP-binding protein